MCSFSFQGHSISSRLAFVTGLDSTILMLFANGPPTQTSLVIATQFREPSIVLCLCDCCFCWYCYCQLTNQHRRTTAYILVPSYGSHYFAESRCLVEQVQFAKLQSRWWASSPSGWALFSITFSPVALFSVGHGRAPLRHCRRRRLRRQCVD